MTTERLLNRVVERLEKNHLSLHSSVLEAFKTVDRRHFVASPDKVYDDIPLPIPGNQTISAPHMYAMMYSNEISGLHPGMDVLEIGTGSGFGCALLAKIVFPGRVVSIERQPLLYEFAKTNLKKAQLDFENLELLLGDGTDLQVASKFDRIFVTAAGPLVPPCYKAQLKENGLIVIPLDRNNTQWLSVVSYEDNREKIDYKFQVRFVPLLGKYGF